MMKTAMIGLAAIAALGIATTSHAVYMVTLDAGTENQTEALTGFGTTGSDMDGMGVTAFFADFTSETVFWADTAPGAGAAFGTGWKITEAGSTFTGAWTLTNTTGKTLASIEIDAGLGDTVYDTDFGGAVGTAGSALGKSFITSDDAGLDIIATYIDEVSLTGDAVVGDLFRSLRIDFQGHGHAGLASGHSPFRYVTDTDNIETAGDIDVIPEPTSLILLSTGFLGLLALKRRKK